MEYTTRHDGKGLQVDIGCTRIDELAPVYQTSICAADAKSLAMYV